MLSQDIAGLGLAALQTAETGNVDQMRKMLVELGLRASDLADRAEHLEAAQVGVAARRMLIDLSDPKITLFPVAKRPVPITTDGGAA